MYLTPVPLTKTSKKRQEAFMKDFNKLLKKHEARFEVTVGRGEGAALIIMLDKCNGTHILAEAAEFYLPDSIDGVNL